ncbi:hypothetical protein M5D96_007697 [Drosophila gunungcola]|uniref:Uncharacterized protein n=1 Tax=Drosophila gunungcola TaxID=103775 RepID=A0A9Q0BNI1_9MUSC|nr:hypothetical protein M5D96_007697 [Drosophila gunungcola]
MTHFGTFGCCCSPGTQKFAHKLNIVWPSLTDIDINDVSPAILSRRFL